MGITKIHKKIIIIIIVTILHYFVTLKAAVCSETSVSTNKTTRCCSEYDCSAINCQFAIRFAVALLFALGFDGVIHLLADMQQEMCNEMGVLPTPGTRLLLWAMRVHAVHLLL